MTFKEFCEIENIDDSEGGKEINEVQIGPRRTPDGKLLLKDDATAEMSIGYLDEAIKAIKGLERKTIKDINDIKKGLKSASQEAIYRMVDRSEIILDQIKHFADNIDYHIDFAKVTLKKA